MSSAEAIGQKTDPVIDPSGDWEIYDGGRYLVPTKQFVTRILGRPGVGRDGVESYRPAFVGSALQIVIPNVNPTI